MVSFENMEQYYSLIKTDFWKYLQLRHCLLSEMSSGPVPNTEIQCLLQYVCLKKGGASIFYNLIRDANELKLGGLKLDWERDIGESIEQWNEAISSWHISAWEVQTQFEIILHRSYWTPRRMARLKLRNDDRCWRCYNETGTMVHMLYDC